MKSAYSGTARAEIFALQETSVSHRYLNFGSLELYNFSDKDNFSLSAGSVEDRFRCSYLHIY
jgi:hypothetical protein